MTFADGLRRERTELLAALTLPWSTGPVAGHVTRLKPIERQVYGRAGLDTLQRRLLRAARSRKGRKSHQTESTPHMTVLAERVDVVIGVSVSSRCRHNRLRYGAWWSTLSDRRDRGPGLRKSPVPSHRVTMPRSSHPPSGSSGGVAGLHP
jgi:hypothetical protein